MTSVLFPRQWCFLILGSLFGSQALGKDPDNLTRVFLFAGQSNMVGADADPKRINEFPSYRGMGETTQEVLFSYDLGGRDSQSQGWEMLRPLKMFGPELTFAKRVRASVDVPIAIIKSAVGGTTVAFDWNPDAPEEGQKLYPRTLRHIRESLEALDNRHIPYRVEAVMWHQGENDMLNAKLCGRYAEGLTKLIYQLRSDLNLPELPWYIAETSEKGIWGMDHRKNLGVLRTEQEKVLQTVPETHWVPTSHLAFEVMKSGQPHYHFGTQGQLQLGEAFAHHYLATIAAKSKLTVPSSSDTQPIASPSRVRLFLLAGQRNMEGEDAYVAQLVDHPGFEALREPQTKALYRYSLGGGIQSSRDWEALRPVDILGNFGPELSFGAYLQKPNSSLNREKETIAILKFTDSGAQMPDWSPQGTAETHRDLYANWIRFIRLAKDDLRSRGLECHVEGVFWHTGENDTYFRPYLQNHSKWMKALIEAVRKDLQQPDLPWFVSEQHRKAPWVNIDAINASLSELASHDSNVHVIPVDDLPHAQHHFGTQGTLLLGERMAETYLEKRSRAKGNSGPP